MHFSAQQGPKSKYSAYKSTRDQARSAGSHFPLQTACFICRVGSMHMGLSIVSLVLAWCLRRSHMDLCRLSLLFDSNTQPQSQQQRC